MSSDSHFRLRVPQDLKRQIERAARANMRSLNSEIVARLEDSFDNWSTVERLKQEIEHYRDRERALHRDLAAAKQALANQFGLSPELSTLVDKAAKENDRSFNAEIAARIEDSFSRNASRLYDKSEHVLSRLEAMDRQLQRLAGVLSREIKLQRELLADPDWLPPELAAEKAGRNAFRSNPEGAYENPYPPESPLHSKYEAGFAMAALIHFRSRDVVKARFPNLRVGDWVRVKPTPEDSQ